MRGTRGLACRGVLDLAAGLMVLLAAQPVWALSQAEITAQALAAYNNMSAAYNWTAFQHIFLDPGSRQYEAGYLAWSEAYNGRARLSRFVATGYVSDFLYLLNSAELIYAARADRVNPPLADNVRGRIMPAWVSKLYTNGTNYAWLVHQGMEMHPIMAAIVELQNRPDLWPTYQTRAQAIINDSIQTLDSFESEYMQAYSPPHAGDADGNGFVNVGDLGIVAANWGQSGRSWQQGDFNSDRTVNVGDLAVLAADWGWTGTPVHPTRGYYNYFSGRLPYNMQNAAGEVFIALWRATGQQRFYDRACMLAKDMKAGLYLVDDRYDWGYNRGGSGEDISHAGINVHFMVDAYEAGIVFDSTDIARLCSTLRFIHRSGAFTGNIDGTGSISTGNIRLAAQWLHLLAYDGALRQELWPTFASICGSPECLALDAAAYFVQTGEAYPPPHAGDADNDDFVNVGDLGILAGNWGHGGLSWDQGNFTGDGRVDAGDLGVLASQWGWIGLPAPGAAVPEPAGLMLLGLGGLALSRRRERMVHPGRKG